MADTKNKAERRKVIQDKYNNSTKGRETRLKNHIKRNYGLEWDTYQEMLESQDNSCAICSEENYREWKDGRINRNPLCVDHCHQTGDVRGLLCNNCNVAIALLKDDITNLTNAINYLKGDYLGRH